MKHTLKLDAKASATLKTARQPAGLVSFRDLR
jgi:hypothetical protein